jgi:hypothetical protein
MMKFSVLQLRVTSGKSSAMMAKLDGSEEFVNIILYCKSFPSLGFSPRFFRFNTDY